MGFLVDSGETYTYEESKKVQQIIKEAGINQFLKLYKQNKQKTTQVNGCQLIWGDEIEFMLINMNEQDHAARLQLNSKEIFNKFYSYPEDMKNQESLINFETKYEYGSLIQFQLTKMIKGSWMIETTPDTPFHTINNINQLVSNFEKRRNQITSINNSADKLLYLSVFPMLGVRDYYIHHNNEIKQKEIKIASMNEIDDPYKQFVINPMIDIIDDYYFSQLNLEKEKTSSSVKKYSSESLNSNEIINQFSYSSFVNDSIITEHQRFYTLTQNIRQRRGEKVNIQMPLFIDKNTSLTPSQDDPYPGKIYMDAMAFGMGNSCLQLTMAAKNISHGRFLYDQLAIISPLFLALSASSPIFKGKLADVDTRWDAICQSVDDRNSEERDQNSQKFIPKSRYGSISYFIADQHPFKKEYNDLNFPVNKNIIEYAKKQAKQLDLSLDENLLQHLGFLFSRDALVVFKNKVENIDEYSTEHFENLQSTNWNSVRFKPAPSLNSSLPWRVEFRTMDLQITDEENALLIYLVLAISMMFYNPEFQLNFYVPISIVDQNFERASKRNALIEEKFFFRKNILDQGEPQIIELYLKDFFFGNQQFIGIQQLLYNFLKEYLPQEKKLLSQYEFLFNFLKDRVEGKKLNTASWMRNFVQKHPLYQQDSIVSEQIAYDLLNNFEQIQSKKISDENFLNYIPQF